MSITKINHYSMTNPASVYDEEAMTSLELAGRTANKVNECIEQVNENEVTVLEAKEYMTTNLPKFVENEVEDLKNSGELETMLVNKVSSGKVDKGGNEQITYDMLAQDVKQAMTGGSVAVVGTNAVNTSNIVDESVSNNKLIKSIRDVKMYTSDTYGYIAPAIIIDSVNKTVAKNESINPLYVFHSHAERYNIQLSAITINATYWNGETNIEFFLDPANNVLYVVPYFKRDTTLNNLLYLGGSALNLRSNIIPFELNGYVICASNITQLNSVAESLLQPKLYGVINTRPDGAYFNYDAETKSVSLTGTWTSFSLYTQAKTYNIARTNLNVQVNENDANGSFLGVYYNPVTNTLIFDAMGGSIVDDINDSLYLGLIGTSPDYIAISTCILPFTINESYYFYPNKTGRMLSKLCFAWANNPDTTIRPRVDFKNRILIIPKCTMFAMTENSYVPIESNTEGDTVIPFPTQTEYCYLVGGSKGLKFVNASELSSHKNKYSVDEVYYFGYLKESTKSIDFTFDCEVARTVSILGDSISTYQGYIPEGNAVYYRGTNAGVTNVNQTWWKRVMNRCGLELNTNQSWSGSKVSTISGEESSGVYRSSNMDNGTDPDVILVYLGINDFNGGVDVGTYDGKGVTPTGTTFRESYAMMIDNILNNYKNSKLYVMTLPPCQRTTEDVVGPEVNPKGVYLSEYNEAIREIADAYGVEVIDTASCGVTYRNGNTTMGDYETGGRFLHPNATGHKLIAQKVIKALLDSAE